MSKPFAVRFSHNIDVMIGREAERLGISFSEWVRRAVLEVVTDAA